VVTIGNQSVVCVDEKQSKWENRREGFRCASPGRQGQGIRNELTEEYEYEYDYEYEIEIVLSEKLTPASPIQISYSYS
jgi:hypothetical protein